MTVSIAGAGPVPSVVPRLAPAAEAPLGRLGALEVRLAADADDLAQAQAVRQRVFRGTAEGADADGFDAVCDHLLVFDRVEAAVVATCRLLRREVAERHRGFYSAGEFALGPLLAAHPGARFIELGRSCVLPSHRGRRTVELLWHGAWAYALAHGADALFGCASLPGTDPDRLAGPLDYLHRTARAEPGWQVRALPGRGVRMDRSEAQAQAQAQDDRAAWRALPPLLKGYLRLGARVGEEAVVDHDFGTTDVFVLLRIAGIAPRYLAHFGPGAERHGSRGPGRELAPPPADAIACDARPGSSAG